MFPATPRLKVPFTLKPTQITNYAHAISELKSFKYEKPTTKYFDEISSYNALKLKIKELGNFFSEHEEIPTVEDILDGIQQEKLKSHFSKMQQNLIKKFVKKINQKIDGLKETLENKCNIAHSITTSDLKYVENNFESDAEYSTFSKPILAELYFLLKNKKDGRKFLEEQFLNFIKRFFKSNAERITVKTGSIEEKISHFVKMRYNKTDFNIEVYEDRFIYAEIYVLMRCGLIEEARKLLLSIPFFNPRFVDKLTTYFDSPQKLIHCPVLSSNEDKFKQIIYKIISIPSSINPNSIISTLEDVLWIRILNLEKNLPVNFEDLLKETKSSTNKLMIHIINQNYQEAQNILLKGDFSAVDAFFLCNEIIKYDFQQSRLYTHFIFLIAKKFESAEKRALIIKKLAPLLESQSKAESGIKEICKNIVEYEFYEILSMLPQIYGKYVIQILKVSNKKKDLLKLYFLNEDELEIIELLEEALIDEISKSSNLKRFEDFEYFEIYNYLISRSSKERLTKMIVLKEFLEFKIHRNCTALQKTKLFDEGYIDLLRGLDCINEIVIIASDIIFKERNSILAYKLINIMGNLMLSSKTQQLLLKNLISTM